MFKQTNKNTWVFLLKAQQWQHLRTTCFKFDVLSYWMSCQVPSNKDLIAGIKRVAVDLPLCLSLGCLNKIPQTWLKQQTLIFSQSRKVEVYQGDSMVKFWEDPLHGLPILAVASHGFFQLCMVGERINSLMSLLSGALITSPGAHPHDLI